MSRLARRLAPEPNLTSRLLDHVRAISQPLRNENDLTPLLNRIGSAPAVLLGEASHGTSEFYQWRAKLSQRLIKEKGFRFIAVEGDWPDCFSINQYVKDRLPSSMNAKDVLSRQFKRWPQWMWGNEEIVELLEWMRSYNKSLPEDKKVGFYGLDVYSLWDSLYVLEEYLKEVDPKSLDVVKTVLACFEPFGEDAQQYALASWDRSQCCEQCVRQMMKKLQERADIIKKSSLEAADPESDLQIEQNATVVRDSERYYRAMVRQGGSSWNIRDIHMADTADNLFKYHGGLPNAKGIIWEHNTHIGDARYTDMTTIGEVNIGQLMRERHGEDNVVLVGFSSYEGTVIAGDSWDAPMEVMKVPSARRNSWDAILHEAGPENKLMVFWRHKITSELTEIRGHRAIGVVYRPERDHIGNYVPTVLPKRYDALLYIDKTQALHPLPIKAVRQGEVEDTFPSGR